MLASHCSRTFLLRATCMDQLGIWWTLVIFHSTQSSKLFDGDHMLFTVLYQ